MPLNFAQEQLRQKIAERLKVSKKDIQSITYLKKSIDARKKPKITVILTVALQVANEDKLQKQIAKDKDLQTYTPYHYTIPKCNSSTAESSPVSSNRKTLYREQYSIRRRRRRHIFRWETNDRHQGFSNSLCPAKFCCIWRSGRNFISGKTTHWDR